MRASLLLAPILLLASLPSCSCGTPDPGVGDAPSTDTGALDTGSLDTGGIDASFDSGLDAASDAGELDDVSAPSDAPDAPTDAGPPCEVPIGWTAETTTEAAATEALLALSPTAMPTWNDARGTFETVYSMSVPLSCPDGAELWDTLLPFIDANEAFLQIDRSEWYPPSSFPCAVVSTTLDYARLDRRDFGPGTVAHDFLSFAVRRVDGGIELRAIIGNYLPEVPDAVAEEMSRCGALSPERARASVMRETFPYSTFFRCTPTGSGIYRPGPLDTITLDPPRWAWTERADGSGVELTSEQPGTVIVHPSYVTPELMASDANCPDESGDARVYGFRVIFDPVSGAILSKLPGIGCIVC